MKSFPIWEAFLVLINAKFCVSEIVFYCFVLKANA